LKYDKMVQRKRNRQGKGNNRTPARTNGNNRQNIPRSLNPGTYQLQEWMPITDSKPMVKASQTVYSWSSTITPKAIPGLQTLMDRYQSVVVHSLGARYKPSLVNTAGLVTLLVATVEWQQLWTIPNPVNHKWMKANGCVAKQLIRDCASPPSNNMPAMKMPHHAKPSSTQDSGTDLGIVWWCFEGPKFDADQNLVGEVEIYINATFSGLK
jgi:hypothetical protein